ncbi:ABC transporter permease [Paenibacillus alginolyticus]|uniref:ABC transporter permease n=1 Tax=Paenibacillus alginolyticus TaxID=59839 RepID=UPI001FEC84BF|nr:ribose ABC transporter permease [Paenibacillus frigoriresistens]
MSVVKSIRHSAWKQKWLNSKMFNQSGVLWALILLCVTASIVSPHFLQFNNLINIIRQISIVGIISIGMTFVILTAGIDLSVGSVVGLVAVISAKILESGGSIVTAILVGIGVGIAVGALNGLGITIGKIQPFIMTLATMVTFRGLAMILSNGSPVSWSKTGLDFSWLGSGDFLSIPSPVWVFIFIFTVAAIVLKYTPFGRYIYSIGDSREASRLSGIGVKKMEFVTYVIIGLLSAISAIVYISRLGVGEPTAGTGMELDAIAMVVIGGTSTFGGEGGVKGTLIGAAIIVVLGNLLNLLGVSPFIQQVVKGIIIALAVLIERQKKRK